MRKCVSACVLKTYDQFTVQAHAKGNRFIPATYSPEPNGQHSNVKDRFVPAHVTRLHSAHVGTRRSTGVVYFASLCGDNTLLTGVFASATADDEIFRADKQHLAANKSRNFSSFHTEQGGPITHMSRPPTADAIGQRHTHADAG